MRTPPKTLTIMLAAAISLGFLATSGAMADRYPLHCVDKGKNIVEMLKRSERVHDAWLDYKNSANCKAYQLPIGFCTHAYPKKQLFSGSVVRHAEVITFADCRGPEDPPVELCRDVAFRLACSIKHGVDASELRDVYDSECLGMAKTRVLTTKFFRQNPDPCVSSTKP